MALAHLLLRFLADETKNWQSFLNILCRLILQLEFDFTSSAHRKVPLIIKGSYNFDCTRGYYMTLLKREELCEKLVAASCD